MCREMPAFFNCGPYGRRRHNHDEMTETAKGSVVLAESVVFSKLLRLIDTASITESKLYDCPRMGSRPSSGGESPERPISGDQAPAPLLPIERHCSICSIAGLSVKTRMVFVQMEIRINK